jgi:hypothetical protein
VEVRPLAEIRATLGEEGSLEGLPFMPEMRPHCGRRYRVQAVMTKICGGGVGMRAVRGEPLLLLDQPRCSGAAHGQCSRACTLLWKGAWLRPAPAAAGGPGSGPEAPAGPGPDREDEAAWPFPIRDGRGGYACQATGLKLATVPMPTAVKVRRALEDVRAGEWTARELAGVYARTLAYKLRRAAGRLGGALAGARATPVEELGLAPGDWVQVKTLGEIAATLDARGRNRGLEFSRYMIPYCGGTHRVAARMTSFIDEGTGEMRTLQNTVLLDGVTCGGETTSGPCRRAELLYFREIWLRRVPGPKAG